VAEPLAGIVVNTLCGLSQLQNGLSQLRSLGHTEAV